MTKVQDISLYHCRLKSGRPPKPTSNNKKALFDQGQKGPFEERYCCTSPGGLEAVEEVYSLDVVGQGGVGHQCAVPVDVGHCKLEGQLLNTDGIILQGLKDAPYRVEEREREIERE